MSRKSLVYFCIALSVVLLLEICFVIIRTKKEQKAQNKNIECMNIPKESISDYNAPQKGSDDLLQSGSASHKVVESPEESTTKPTVQGTECKSTESFYVESPVKESDPVESEPEESTPAEGELMPGEERKETESLNNKDEGGLSDWE